MKTILYYRVIINFTFVILVYLFISGGLASAQSVTPPDFPFCSNPTSVIKVHYQSGTHGIVGSTETHSGSDTVYSLPEGNHLQCFCADDGSGVQTSWWRFGNVTQTQRDILAASGWLYIPNGKLWGLEETAYLAKNNNYSCKTGTNGSNTNNSGSVLSAASNTIGNVLGLASTGNLPTIFGLFGTGIIALVTSVILKKKASK